MNTLVTEGANTAMSKGLEYFESFIIFEKDDIKSLFSRICNSGGLVPNPDFDTTAQNPVSANILNPGIIVVVICEGGLVQAAYGDKIYSGINIYITPQSLSVARFNAFRKHRVTVDNHNDP